jgi:hypothetical protein
MILFLYALFIILFILAIFFVISFVMDESVFYIDNLLAFTGAFLSHLLAEQVILPILWSPRRFYSPLLGLRKYPWEPPGFVIKTILVPILIYFVINIFNVVAFQMYSLRKCKRNNFKRSLKYATLSSGFGIIGYILVVLIPILKVPIIMLKDKVPFGQNLVFGLFIGLFSFIGYTMFKKSLNDDVCYGGDLGRVYRLMEADMLNSGEDGINFSINIRSKNDNIKKNDNRYRTYILIREGDDMERFMKDEIFRYNNTNYFGYKSLQKIFDIQIGASDLGLNPSNSVVYNISLPYYDNVNNIGNYEVRKNLSNEKEKIQTEARRLSIVYKDLI